MKFKIRILFFIIIISALSFWKCGLTQECTFEQPNQQTCAAVMIQVKTYKVIPTFYQWSCRKVPSIPTFSPMVVPISQPFINLSKTPFDEVEPFFDKLFEEIPKFIPLEAFFQKPLIFLRGSGEICTLTQDQQSDFLFEIRKLFKNKNDSFLFKHDSQVYLDCGSEEGINIWTSINYALNNFETDVLIKIENMKTSPIIQIDELTSKIVFGHKDKIIHNSRHIDLSGKNYFYLSSMEIDQLAIRNAQKKLLTLMEESTENTAFCFSRLAEDKNYQKFQFQFKGNFDAEKCINQIFQILNIQGCQSILNNSEGDESDCYSFSPFYISQEKDEKVVIVGSAYYSKVLLFGRENNPINVLEFRRRAIEYCTKELPNNLEKSRVYSQCFQAMFVSTLLIDGLGLSNREILIPELINGLEIDWNIGYFLRHLTTQYNCDCYDAVECQK